MRNKLNWSKSKVSFKDSKRKALTAEDHFEDDPQSIEDIKKHYQAISNKYANIGVPVKIACARHYKNINKWVPGTFTKAGDDVELYADGEGENSFGNLLDGDQIDGLEYYLVVDGDASYFEGPKIHPGKSNIKGHTSRINKEDFFGKKKK
jgi:hypothetical protein